LKGTRGFQIIETKCKENTLENKKEQWFFKKAKGKQSGRYYRDIRDKMGGPNPCERCVCTG